MSPESFRHLQTLISEVQRKTEFDLEKVRDCDLFHANNTLVCLRLAEGISSSTAHP